MTIGPKILSAAGATMDQNQNGVTGEIPADEYAAVVRYDSNPLAVASTTPADGSVITPPFTSITMHFNQAYDPTTVNTSNLTLSQGTVSAFTLVNSQTITYTLTGITFGGAITVSMAFDAY